MNADNFLNWFEEALPLVNPYYYGIDLCSEGLLNLLGIDDDYPEIEKVRDYLLRYGERSFCYELYHQIRAQMETYIKNNPDDQNEPPLVLHGELKKNMVTDIVNILPGLNEALSKEYIPDFLFHSPGPYDFQEVVVEVKATPKLDSSLIKADLLKIQEFINKYNYRLGIFLAINVDPNRILEIFNKDKNLNWIDENINTKERIERGSSLLLTIDRIFDRKA